jgi:hypothetical protein
MKKIRLTESELKKMIINVMEQVADNNEGGPNYSLEEYEKMLDSHINNIYDSISDIMDLFNEISGDTSLDPQDKEDMLDTIRGTLDQFGVSSREYDYADDEEETIDVDHEEEIEDTDDEDVTGDMDENV